MLTLPLGLDAILGRGDLPPQLTGLSQLQLMLLALVNPLLLVAGAALIGAAIAHRVGLHSHLARGLPQEARGTLVRELATAAVAGLVLGSVVAVLDLWLVPRLDVQDLEQTRSWRTLAMGIGYGGLSEEVIARWGVMSGAIWLVMRIARMPVTGAPAPARAAWIGIIAAALAFGAAHLPAVAAAVPLTPGLIARTVGLNALAGAVYGWFFWRRSLESAMAAHASTHVGLALLLAAA